MSLRRLAKRDKEYETSASGRRSAGIMSAISRKSTNNQVGPQSNDEAARITPVEQSTNAAASAATAAAESPTPTAKERPRSNFLYDFTLHLHICFSTTVEVTRFFPYLTKDLDRRDDRFVK